MLKLVVNESRYYLSDVQNSKKLCNIPSTMPSVSNGFFSSSLHSFLFIVIRIYRASCQTNNTYGYLVCGVFKGKEKCKQFLTVTSDESEIKFERKMNWFWKFLFIVLFVQQSTAVKLNYPRVLLPIFDKLSINFTLEVIEGGCFKW